MIFKKWLYHKTNSFDDITNKQVIDDLFDHLLEWYNTKDELLLINEIDDFKIYFYLFMYNNMVELQNNADYEYFNYQYSDDIVDLFLKFKNITKGYGSMLLYGKRDNSNNLLEFIHIHCEIIEEGEITDSVHEEEKHLNQWE
jgi:hypothetical protein